MNSPISKIQIKGFIESSFVDWSGKLTAVIFLPLCNFRCPYCHNRELVLEPNKLETLNIDDILSHLSRYRGWLDGICVTGGEPTIHEGLPELLRYIKDKSSLLVKIDTNGTNPEMLQKLIDAKLLDSAAMDVKAPLDDLRYYKAAGTTVDLERIKKSIDILMNSGLDVEFRTTIHPKLFTQKDIIDLCEQLKGVKKFKLQNFNKYAETIDPSLSGTDPFDDETFKRFQKLADGIIKGQ